MSDGSGTRAETVAHPSEMSSQHDYIFGPFRLSLINGTLTRDDMPIEMSRTIFDALSFFVRNADRLVTKDELMEAVWHGRIVEESNLRQTVSALRKALGAEGQELIATVSGRGYRFAARPRRIRVTALPEDPGSEDAGGVRGRQPRENTPPGGMRRWRWVALAGGVLTTVTAVWLFGTGSRLGPNHLVVLADFSNQTHEAIFDGSLQNLLRVDLGQSPFVNVMPDKQARATLALMEKPDGTALSQPVAAEICQRNNADAVVQGSIAPIGSAYLVSLAASDCASGRQLAAAQRQVDKREAVAPALDTLIASVRRQLGESFASVQKYNVPLVEERTGSLDALKALSEAQWLFEHGKLSEAIPVAGQALALDPDLVAAHKLLGVIHLNLRDLPSAVAELTKAYARRDRLNERDRGALSALYDQYVLGDERAAIGDLQALTALYPFYVAGWSNLANAENDLGQFDAAVAAGRQALALNPTLEAAYVVTARAERSTGRLDDAWATTQAAVAHHLDGPALHRERLAIALAKEDATAVVAEAAWAEAHPSQLMDMTEGEWAISQGRIADAANLFAAINRLPGQPGQSDPTLTLQAGLLAQIGMEDAARALLARYAGDGNDPDLLDAQSIVGDPARIEALLARLQAANPKATLLTQIYIPQARAELALRRGDSTEALRQLQAPLTYQARAYRTLSLAGAAYLAQGDGARAATAYRTILAHRGWRPESPLYPLARLGLARALRLQRDFAGSHAQYAAFLAGFAHADSTLPLAQAAAVEQRLH